MPPLRISIVGCSGSGKSTLAREIEAQLGLPRLELDGVFHQPNWEPLPDEPFRERVNAFMDRHDEWIIDGNYGTVRSLVWERATTVLWLHPSRWRTMRQVCWRTLRRGLTRKELWNGNREPLSTFHSFKPEKSIIAWAWTTYPKNAETYTALFAEDRWSGLDTHRFEHRRDIQQWLGETVQARSQSRMAHITPEN